MNNTGQGNPGQGGVVPLFATPFAALNTGADREFHVRLASLFESRRIAAPDDSSRDALHYRGTPDLLDSADETAVELRRLILGHAAVVVANLNDGDPAGFGGAAIRARGWCSIVQRNGHVPCQHFQGASWLAVYCAQAGECDAGAKGSGVLRLYERRLGSIYRDAGNSDMKSPFRFGNHSWTPMPGWMALFPAHVPHEVSVVRSATPLILVFALLRFVDNR